MRSAAPGVVGWTLASVGALVGLVAACSSDEGSVADVATTVAATATTVDEPTPATSTGADQGTTTSPAPEVVAPFGVPLVDGLPTVELLGPPEVGAGEAPEFRWQPVAEAVRYSLAVRGPDGPLWGWQGVETQIYLGGLPFERPPGWAGPVLPPGSCWSVVARDADGHVIAASDLVPVSPGESPGTPCRPGEGVEP